MNLDELLSLQTLKLKRSKSGLSGPLADYAIEQSGIQTQNVCAKISIPLFNRLDHVCTTLDLTKREFVEAALVDAIKRAEASMETLFDQFDKE